MTTQSRHSAIRNFQFCPLPDTITGMSDDRRKSGWVFWFAAIAATVVGALALYSGVYLWMVEAEQNVALFGSWTQPRYQWGTSGSEVGNPELLETVFSPIHDLNRKIRPTKWAAHSYRGTANPHATGMQHGPKEDSNVDQNVVAA